MKNIINITKEEDTGSSQILGVTTSSFILLYLKDGKVRVEGDIELRDIAPMLMKYAAEKMTR